MDADPIRWVVMKAPGHVYEIISGPWSQLEGNEIPAHQRLGFETVAVVDSEAEARNWVEAHRLRALP
jgi:hypothetical protein